MKLFAVLALALAATVAQAAEPIRISCTRDNDTFAGYASFNVDSKIITIENTSWTLVDNGSGVWSSGNLATPGPYVRLNRFNGTIAARWRPSTPVGALDMIGVCDAMVRKF